jgi:hypothetical protein
MRDKDEYTIQETRQYVTGMVMVWHVYFHLIVHFSNPANEGRGSRTHLPFRYVYPPGGGGKSEKYENEGSGSITFFVPFIGALDLNFGDAFFTSFLATLPNASNDSCANRFARRPITEPISALSLYNSYVHTR